MVSRLRQRRPSLPSPMAQAKAGKPGWIRRGAFITGCQLKRWGINFNLAPVLDRNTNRNNPVIGVRSFGGGCRDGLYLRERSRSGISESRNPVFGQALPDTGIRSGFPSALPVLEKSEEELESCELVPFRRMVEEKIPAITVAHVVAPAISGSAFPAR